MDVHVPLPITEQLRRKGVDVLTAQEDGSNELEDDDLLERVGKLGRVLFTQDIRFKALAENWQRIGRSFAGLVYGHQNHGIGPYVRDLELIAKATDPSDWETKLNICPTNQNFFSSAATLSSNNCCHSGARRQSLSSWAPPTLRSCWAVGA